MPGSTRASATEVPPGAGRGRWRRLRRSPAALVGIVAIAAVVGAALLAGALAPRDPTEVQPAQRLQPPSARHPFGTDELGRDVLSRVLHGARVSLWVGAVAVGIGAVAGTALGLVAGYSGGATDLVVMRLMDVLFAFPAVLLALAIVAALGPSLVHAMLAIGVVYVPIFTRTVRAATLSLREREFVEAAVAAGVPTPVVLLRHILPNALSPLLVQFSLAFSGAVLTEASLSFLGLGIQPPEPSWGAMLSASRRYMEFAPWTALFPAAATAWTVLGFNLLGDGLRDAMDPTLRR